MSASTDSTAQTLRIGLAQIAPVWLDRAATTEKIVARVREAGEKGCDLVAFGEALLPGYPIWLDRTGGAVFDSPPQKATHALYMANAVDIEAGDLKPIQDAAAQAKCAAYVGIIERPADRGGHSLYASLVYLDKAGQVQSVHRKLMPTYEERLTWSPGDGHGLRVHKLGAFTVGGLNCWENWMPLPRAALYGLGEDLHIAVWPGAERNTRDITRFIARESRSYVVSVSGTIGRDDIPKDVPNYDALVGGMPETMLEGGSCAAGPDGEFVLEPQTSGEGLFTIDIDHARVREERQNFDPVGHYSRPDVTQLHVHRERQSTLSVSGD